MHRGWEKKLEPKKQPVQAEPRVNTRSIPAVSCYVVFQARSASHKQDRAGGDNLITWVLRSSSPCVGLKTTYATSVITGVDPPVHLGGHEEKF